MARDEDVSIPPVDEPIGSIVARIQEEDPEIGRLVGSLQRALAFRTFAHIRVGALLGRLLADHDIEPYDGSEEWVAALLRDPAHHARLAREVRAVAEEVGADPKYADEQRVAGSG